MSRSSAELLADVVEGHLPADGLHFAVGLANQRLGDAVFVVGEVECVTALVAEEVAVDAGLVAVVAADDLASRRRCERTPRVVLQPSPQWVQMVRDVVHLPRARLVAIGAAGERAYGAGVDAHAALLAVDVGEVVGGHLRGDVGRDDRGAAAVLDAEGEDVHAFAAHADAAVAEDAARAVEVDDRRPLLLFAVVLGLGVEAVGGAILEGHVLQLALAAGIADGAVERMVAEQQLQRGFAGLGDLGRLGLDDHALGDRRSAGGLELGHLLDADDAHAAGGLQREAGVVTEGGDLDAGGLAGLDEQGACGGGDFVAVYGKGYVCHLVSCSDELLDGDDGGSGFVAFDVVFKLFAELLDEADGGHGRCVAERAEGAAHHVFGEVLDVVDVFLVAAAVVDAGEGLLDPVGALAAGDAPAAGFVLVEGDGAEGEFDDGDGLVEHDDAA